jgi:hypothetical protein
MAGRYPDYDWRGIAMLTQQLGQLFEPSKAKLMSQQQEHEMNMLMAKQAWDTQSKQITQLENEYSSLIKEVDIQTEAVNKLGLNDLVLAGMKDGALPEEASAILELDIKNLSDMQELANQYREMIRGKKETLDNMQLYNTTAKLGEDFRAGSMEKKMPKSGGRVDYYEGADKDGIPGLSYEEGQNAIKAYITDNYLVAEGEEGMQMDFGIEGKPDIITVKPEAIAFRAGWESGTGTGTGRGKAEKTELSQKQAIKDAEIKLMGDKTMNQRTNEELLKMTDFNRNIVEELNKKGGDRPLSMLVESRNGKIQLKEKAKVFGYTNDEVIQYLASLNVYNNGVEELGERQIQFKPMSTGQPDAAMLKDFDLYDTHPDSLMSQISISNKADKDDAINSYNEFLERAPKMGGVERRKAIQVFQEWLR